MPCCLRQPQRSRLFFGSALSFVPGIGPLFVAGPLVAWMVGGLEGATVVGGLSALGAGPFSIGIPRDSVLAYETQIKAGKFVVIAHGTRDELAKGRAVLAGATQYEAKAHSAPAVTAFGSVTSCDDGRRAPRR